MLSINNLKCPVCNTTLLKLVKVTDSRFVYKCGTCEIRRLLPLPTLNELKKLYGRKEYYTDELAELHNDLKINYNKSTPIVKLYKRHLHIISTIFPPIGKLMEIGCARGVFLDLARKSGYKVKGIEMNPYAYKYARHKFKLDVELTSIENYKIRKPIFDIVIAYDVIEHVTNPEAFIKKIYLLLKPGGIMVIGTPDSDSLLYQMSEAIGRISNNLLTYPLYRYYGRGVEHLTIFNRHNLELLSKKIGFVPIQTYGYSIPANNITNIPNITKPLSKLITYYPYEFVLLAIKRGN